MVVAPSVSGCAGFPSTLVGCPVWLSTRRPLVYPSCAYPVAKWSALPGVTSSGRRTKGTIFSFGFWQAAAPAATAVETPTICMKSRRETPLSSLAPAGNSLAAPGVVASARSSIERQSFREPVEPGGEPAAPFESKIGSDLRARSLARASWLSSQLMTWFSSVTGGAAGSRVDVVLLRELLAGFLGIALRLPVHVRDLRDRPEVLFRMAVAAETEAHGQGGVLLDRRHLVDPSVAAHAADAFVHVDGVIEIDELRHLVDAPPLDRLVLNEALANRLQELALVPDLRMAVKTKLRGRDAGRRGLVDRVVAVAAVDPLVTRVVTVIELNGLLDRVLHAPRVRRLGVEEQASRNSQCPRRHDKQRDPCERVVSGPKERTHPRRAAFMPSGGATSSEVFADRHRFRGPLRGPLRGTRAEAEKTARNSSESADRADARSTKNRSGASRTSVKAG